jgi:hemolysin III
MTFTIRQAGSSLTHFFGMILAMMGAIPLLAKAISTDEWNVIVSMHIFIISMIMLYAASSTYHGLNLTGKKLRIFRKIDHMMIFVLIAGSYTPICMITLGDTIGYYYLPIIWTLAFIGILVKAFWITCPKWFSSVIYIAMGWFCIFMFQDLLELLPRTAFTWLLIGGIIYTLGGILYALKLKAFNNLHPEFGSHEIFHLFIMGGSACHFVCMYHLIA